MTTPIHQSNSLTVLAARINAEHAETSLALERGVEHALAAGDLLIEAKQQLPHGQWAPWIKANCPGISGRTIRLYMQLARNRDELEANRQPIANLTLQGAVKALAAPEPTGGDDLQIIETFGKIFGDKGDEMAEMADAAVNGPFVPTDFSRESFHWLLVKLLHQCPNMPLEIAVLLSMEDEHGDVLPMCSAEELVTALDALAPVQKGKVGFDFAFAGGDVLVAHLGIKLLCQREIAKLCHELNLRGLMP
jgi:hypothetical protein